MVLDPFYVLESPDWVHVAAFDDEQRLLLTRQYRHGTQAISVELPCGMMERGETPEEAMIRELREETGAEASQLFSLAKLAPNPARRRNTVHSFAALGTRITGEQCLDTSENIEFEFVPLRSVLKMIEVGEFNHALHIATLFLAIQRLELSIR